MSPAAAASHSLAEGGLPTKGRVGMACLILTESSFFAIFVVAHLFYAGKSLSGPYENVLEAPVLASICLLSSSLSIVLAIRALGRGARTAFLGWWALTIALGLEFLLATGFEWARLIGQGLTIRSNLLGTTYYSLVGFHALHVTLGLAMLSLVLVLGIGGHVRARDAERCELLSWYWHFVDVVWIVVFTTVYVVR